MKSRWTLIHQESGQTVASALEIADGLWSRFKGLQLRRSLPAGAALLLVPCSAVHTFWMRFPIDVALLDRRGQVVALRRQVRPWRIVLPARDGYATLELPAGAAHFDVGAFLRLHVDEASPTPPPRSVAFLCPASERKECV